MKEIKYNQRIPNNKTDHLRVPIDFDTINVPRNVLKNYSSSRSGKAYYRTLGNIDWLTSNTTSSEEDVSLQSIEIRDLVTTLKNITSDLVSIYKQIEKQSMTSEEILANQKTLSDLVLDIRKYLRSKANEENLPIDRRDNPTNETGLSDTFRTLSDEWHEETDALSSPSQITNNDSYLQIIALGKSAIPLILNDLKERGGSWFRALRILTSEDPVEPEMRGNIHKMRDAWIEWGHTEGYI